MRARSAYISSFGTSGLLVLAALIMLAIVSAIVAFNGWPSGASAARVESVAIVEPMARAVPEATVIRVRTEPRTSRPRPARRSRVTARAPRATPTARDLPPAPTAPDGSGAQPQPAQPGPAPAPQTEPASPPVLAPEQPAGPGTGGTIGTVTGTVETVTGAVTDLLAPVAPR